ncbi:hypothetical protein pdam_00001815, partial [Pocillopora damicornis]
GLWRLCNEHLSNGGEPEAVFVSEIVTGTTTMAFKERIVAESSETRSRRGKRLTTTTSTSTMAYHQEAESIPNGLPAGRTVWVLCGLTMSGNNRPRCLTHSTPTDKRLNSGSTDWHHGNLYICGQPITVIVSRSVVALLVYVTKK